MGEVSDTMTKKRKKKGRPSLLDLQKRSLKQERKREHPKPILTNSIHNPSPRFPTPNSSITHPQSDWIPTTADDDDDDERTKKKHKLLHGLNTHHQYPTFSDGDDPHKRRKTNFFSHGSDPTDEKVPKATDDDKLGSQVESGPTTPLPDKKLLVFILDRLQKKDTHGVFSEPVDPEELPDYHDIIEHPMDFGTVRKKLDGGAYANLEHFEKDVLLICSNAMQYNAPDTIYFRQARTMQELAKKDFANLRQDSDDNDSEPQPKIVRRGRPPGKNLKKSLNRSPVEHIGPESSSDATLASGGDNTRGSDTYNLRKSHPRIQVVDSSVKACPSNFGSGGYNGWMAEWENEFPASVLKAVLKYGKKQSGVDENKRDTYNNSLSSGDVPQALASGGIKCKQLMEVGLHVEHSYARSLAQFAAGLGPVVWKIAQNKIKSALPSGHRVGPGWIEENEVSQQQKFSACDQETSASCSLPVDQTRTFLTQSSHGLVAGANTSSLQSRNMVTRSSNFESKLAALDNSYGASEPVYPFKIHQHSRIQSDLCHSSNGLVLNNSPQSRMVSLVDLSGSTSSNHVPRALDENLFSKPTLCTMPATSTSVAEADRLSDNFSRSDSGNSFPLEPGIKLRRLPHFGFVGRESWQGFPMNHVQNSFTFAGYQNVKSGATHSHDSNVNGSPQQPDLALQL